MYKEYRGDFMRKPRFYYTALKFKNVFNMLSELEVSKIKLNSDYEYYSREGFFRGNHYNLIFTRQDKIVTVSFVYTNFKRPHCDFNITYTVLYSDVLKKFVDFKDFCLTMVDIDNGFFYKEGFKESSKFL